MGGSGGNAREQRSEAKQGTAQHSTAHGSRTVDRRPAGREPRGWTVSTWPEAELSLLSGIYKEAGNYDRGNTIFVCAWLAFVSRHWTTKLRRYRK